MLCSREGHTLLQEISLRIYRLSVLTLVTSETKGNGAILMI